MVSGFWRVLCTSFLLMSSPFVVASHAQQPAAPPGCSCLVQPFFRSASDLLEFLPQPGSLKTSWILFESEFIHVSWAAVFLVMAALDAAMTASGTYRMMS